MPETPVTTYKTLQFLLFKCPHCEKNIKFRIYMDINIMCFEIDCPKCGSVVSLKKKE